MRILFVTQMWPSPANPDLGSFLVPVVGELRAAGHEVEVVAISERGGSQVKYAGLSAKAIRAARRFRADVVFAHFLFPTGFAAALASATARIPLVVMAHGQDVANLETMPWVRRPTRLVLRRASRLIVNSAWLGAELERQLGEAVPPYEVIDCGIDLERFAPRPAAEARSELDWEGEGPALLCVGSLIGRKNVVELADAFAELGRGRLAYVGDGPLRGELEGRDRVRLVGRVAHRQVPRWIAACDVVCQPSRREPFGQALLEAMAMERTVVATKVGGPAEFVSAQAGVLVDPNDPAGLLTGLERAIALPAPNPGARVAAAGHDVVRQTERMAKLLEAAIASA